MTEEEEIKESAKTRREWAKNVFMFSEDALGFLPAEPMDDLLGKTFEYEDGFENKRETTLFNKDGRLLHADLKFYEVWMFKNQGRAEFRAQDPPRFTWQQTVLLEAYNRAINTFGKDSFEEVLRWITVRSGHGVGKTGSMAIIAIHFLICFDGSQIGMTSNTEQQVQDIFMKEFSVWKNRLPENLANTLNVTVDHVRVEDTDDWFLRAQVARPERPEAIAGLHGEYILILVDEASAINAKVIETMKGSLTGENFVVIYTGNPTRNEGEFYESHKPGARYTQLHFSSRHSPIVKEGYIKNMEEDYPSTGGETSDEVKIRVDGEHAGEAEMDEKGWIPLFGNLVIQFEPERGQVINHALIGVDPAGRGRDRSIVHVRDNIYLKEVLNEATSNEKDLARKIETIRDVYNCVTSDIAIEAFGIGAKVVAEVQSKINDSPIAVLTDKPREEVKEKYNSQRSELGWLFREWLAKGGIIITNNKKAWIAELNKIKYKRDIKGRIVIMNKVEFKKEYSFSPDRFDAATMTFVKAEPTMPVRLSKAQLEQKDNQEWLQRAQQQSNPTREKRADPYSSM